MTISFFVNKNDLDQIDLMIKKSSEGIFDSTHFKTNLYTIECFNTTDEIKRRLDVRVTPNTNFIQVNIEYNHYLKIKEYLKF